MQRSSWLTIALAACCLLGAATPSEAYWPLMPYKRAMTYNWHANYAHNQYGQPVAMVIPPTAYLQTNWSWGYASSRVSRVDHQFSRFVPDYSGGGPYRNTPAWPQDTVQFGVYNVRAPW